jgi:hypothetical protein
LEKWKQQQEIEVTRQLFEELPQPSRIGLIVPKYVVVQKFQDKDELYQDEEPVTITQKNEELKLQEGMTITSLKNFQDSVWPYQDEEVVFDGLLEQELELRSDMVWESSHQRLDLADFDARIQLAYQMNGLFLCFYSLVFPSKEASFIQLHTLWARCSKEGGIVTRLGNSGWRVMFMSTQLTRLQNQVQDEPDPIINRVEFWNPNTTRLPTVLPVHAPVNTITQPKIFYNLSKKALKPEKKQSIGSSTEKQENFKKKKTKTKTKTKQKTKFSFGHYEYEE